MGAACFKGKGTKKDKKAKEIIGEKNIDKLNVEEHKIQEKRNQEENKIQEEKRNLDENTNEETERSGSPTEEKKRPIDVNDKARIKQMVMEAIGNTKGLVTLPQIEAYISDKFRNFPINSYQRRAIFTKVIANEFYRGQIAVKSNKHC